MRRLDLGLIKAGFDIVVANDVDRHAADTYRNNISQDLVCGDIRDTDVIEQIIRRVGDKKIDLIVGGPPCQASRHWAARSRQTRETLSFPHMQKSSQN